MKTLSSSAGCTPRAKRFPTVPPPISKIKELTVPQLDEKTGCSLANAHRSGSPGAARRDSHLVLSKSFFPRNVMLRVLLHGNAGCPSDYRSLRDRFSRERLRVAIFRSSRFSGEAVVVGASGAYREGQDQRKHETEQPVASNRSAQVHHWPLLFSPLRAAVPKESGLHPTSGSLSSWRTPESLRRLVWLAPEGGVMVADGHRTSKSAAARNPGAETNYPGQSPKDHATKRASTCRGPLV